MHLVQELNVCTILCAAIKLRQIISTLDPYASIVQQTDMKAGHSNTRTQKLNSASETADCRAHCLYIISEIYMLSVLQVTDYYICANFTLYVSM